jgi:PAS domain S-box-containing protein
VVCPGEYVADDSFIHTPELDDYIKRRAMRSVMSAPLEGPSGGMGALTVQSARANAFDADDAELLELLANQAAIAITNTRLYDELQSSESRYRFLVDNSPDMIWALDEEGRFTFVSESVERIFGIPPAEAIGRHWRDLTDPDSFDAAQERWEQMHVNPAVEHQLRITALRPDGGRVPVDIHMVATTIDGRFAGVHGSLRDISERLRLEEDLRRQAAELAASGERAHLARELHDSVTQAIFSIGLTLRALELQLQTDPEAARAKLTELRELQRDALAEMRTLIFELRPASLETDGLVQALRTHAAAVQGRTGLAISVDAEPMDRMSLPVEEALYRIVQEALHNVVKHANAQRAAIRLARDGEQVRLSIEDDGDGFDPEAVPRGHLGLIGMRQRADLVGLELTVRSQPRRGTRVEICVPSDLARPQAAEAELASVN